MCGDYRASFHLDRGHDAEDREAGRRISAPALVLTGEDETQLRDAPEVWRRWADDLTGGLVPGGHFIPEESPEALAQRLNDFLAE
jgi:haloacetate dehalogenase